MSSVNLLKTSWRYPALASFVVLKTSYLTLPYGLDHDPGFRLRDYFTGLILTRDGPMT